MMEIETTEKEILPSVIYRYKFTEDFMEELYKFSKIHQYDDRKDFKEAWEIWNSENEELVDEEMRRLLRLGYDGDIKDKMFKSARYYFRKKNIQIKEPRQRRQYINIGNELLNSMDTHIKLNNQNQPKIGFELFCRENEELVKQSIIKLKDQQLSNSEIQDKIKKTYKNRYFRLTNK
jgi:hypothetical protein